MYRHGDAWISTIRRLGYATSILFPAAGDWQLRQPSQSGTRTSNPFPNGRSASFVTGASK